MWASAGLALAAVEAAEVARLVYDDDEGSHGAHTA